VVCTFVFVHQADTANILAGGGGSQLTGIQFVDDAHVPHNPNNAYFIDRYGARQHVLSVNRGDQGTMAVEFPLIDPRVGSGELHLGQQVLGGIPVNAPGTAAAAGGSSAPGAPAGPNLLATGGNQASAPTIHQASAAPATGSSSNACGTPQMANTAACKLNSKITSAESSANSTAAAVAAPVNSIKQLGDTLGGLFNKKTTPASTTTAAPAQAAQPQ
jgi:hypothetical protein